MTRAALDLWNSADCADWSGGRGRWGVGDADRLCDIVLHRGSCSWALVEKPAEVFGRGSEVVFPPFLGGVGAALGLVELGDHPLACEDTWLDAAGGRQAT